MLVSQWGSAAWNASKTCILDLSVIGKTYRVYPTLDRYTHDDYPTIHEVDHQKPTEPIHPVWGTSTLRLLVKRSDYKSNYLHR